MHSSHVIRPTCSVLLSLSLHKHITDKANDNPQALPFSVTFAAGAIAGISEILTFYPLDVVKTRMQLDTSKGTQSLVGSFRSIVAQEGYVPSLDSPFVGH